MSESNNKQFNMTEEFVNQFIHVLKDNLKIRNMIRVAIRSFDEQDIEGFGKNQEQKARKYGDCQ